MNDCQQAVRAECAEENTLFALLVVDQLTANCKVQAIGRFAQIVNLHRRPVFTETVRQHSTGARGARKIDDSVPYSIDTSNALDFNSAPGAVLYLDFKLAIRPVVVHANRISQIWPVRHSGAFDIRLLCSPEIVKRMSNA